MENVIHRLTLDLTGADTIPRVEVQQDNARSLSISLTQGGRPYWIAEGVTAVFSGRKPDGNPLFNGCTIEKNRVRYDFTAQTTNVAGIVECEILLYSGDERILASPRFELAIDELIHRDGDVPESAPEISALTRMVAAGTAMIEDLRAALGELEGVEEILTQARTAAEAASNSEAAAKSYAQTAHDAAGAAASFRGDTAAHAQSASKSAQGAEEAADRAEAARTAAERAEQVAGAAAVTATQEAGGAAQSARDAETYAGQALSAKSYAEQATFEAKGYAQTAHDAAGAAAGLRGDAEYSAQSASKSAQGAEEAADRAEAAAARAEAAGGTGGGGGADLTGYATEEWVQEYVEEHSGQNVGKCLERLYVEDYKTDKNTWNDAFDALFAECLASGRVACTGGTYYALTAPLYIGNIDVDFENCELSNNVPESESNPACVVLTGAEKRVQKFGTVTGRQSVGILVNAATGVYKFNRLHAKLIQGWSGALWLSTTKYTCCFNAFHVPLLKSADVALKTWCESRKTKWVNECHFYLASIERYRSTYPTKLIEMTNATRCNIYNVDLECGDWQTPDPNRTVEVELTDCCDVAFYNPRTAEGFNAVQFRFVGECFSNFIDAEYSKFSTIDSSQMALTDRHYNVWRGRVVTANKGSTTNASTLRIYKDMVVPETLTPMTADVTNGITVTSAMIPNLTKLTTKNSSGGVPTLLKWSGGNITIDGRFIALLPATIQIMRTGEGVGDILDMDGSTIMDGSELTMGARYNICVDSVAWAETEPVGEYSKEYPHIAGVTLAIVGADGITPHIGSNGNWYIGTTDTGVKAQGTDGSDGRGITAIERTSGNGAAGTVDTYTVTYTDGTTSTYQVRNGANGKDGKTPVKGEDYFTEADKSEMVSAVISALPKYNGEVVAV